MRFRERASQAIEEAHALVKERNSYNTIVSLPDMFPHGVQDLTYELHKKSSRMLGLIQASVVLPVGDWDRCKALLQAARDHAIDMINYSAFTVALLDEDLGEKSEDSDHPTPSAT